MKNFIVYIFALLKPVSRTKDYGFAGFIARADSVIDIYDAASGTFVRTLGNHVAFNPLTISAM